MRTVLMDYVLSLTLVNTMLIFIYPYRLAKILLMKMPYSELLINKELLTNIIVTKEPL